MTPRKIIFWEVDVQADFMLPGGKLYVPGAEKIIPNVERLVQAARESGIFLVSSGDAHAPDDPEFKVFPPHCVKGTSGARILPQGLMQKHLTIPNEASSALPANVFDYPQIVLEKQTLDVFDNPKASELVQRIGDARGRDAEYVVFGVVTEYCVRCAAKGLLERGCKVAVVEDAIETLKPDEGRATLEELTRLGARLITSDEAMQMAATAGAQKVI
jgi:nicotinamidase/pyrazinamidase